MITKRDMIIKAGYDRYPVIFSDFRARLAEFVEPAGRAIVISNPKIFALYGKTLIERILPRGCQVLPIQIGDGEKFKTQATINRLYDHFIDLRVRRHETIIAFGGGIVGDTAGYAAATFMRGVGLIQVPTTLLSMVDSSIGGKVGINHRLGKNLIGAFSQPRAVVIDPRWLTTLDSRELLAGWAEIVKTGFLSSADFLKQLAAHNPFDMNRDSEFRHYVIQKSIAYKARLISRDPHDYGVRNLLNLGHTFAHAIEITEGAYRYRHGEAVLAGLVGALYLSRSMQLLSEKHLKEYLGYLSAYMAKLPPLRKNTTLYLQPIALDKKRRGSAIRFILLKKAGIPVIMNVESERKVLAEIESMQYFVNGKGKV